MRKSFEVLDGLRGVAAVCVVLFHYKLLDRLIGQPSHAYLAVDLFFMISGFVIAHAYEDRLRSGLSFGGFLRLRLLRLYPLHALGMILGAAVVAALLLAGGGRDLSGVGWLLVLGLSFAPRLEAGDHDLFPLNGPAWSLMLELGANLIYAAAAPRLGDRALKAIVLACGMWLLGIAVSGRPLNGGAHAVGMTDGFARVGFGFFLGVLLLRLHRRGRLRVPALQPLLLLVGVAAVLVAPSPAGWSGLHDAVVVLVILPLTVASAAACAPSKRLGDALVAIGRPSYALYVVHIPVQLAAMTVFPGLLGRASDLHTRAVQIVTILALTAALAMAVERWYHPLARRWLDRILLAIPGREDRVTRADMAALRRHGSTLTSRAAAPCPRTPAPAPPRQRSGDPK